MSKTSIVVLALVAAGLSAPWAACAAPAATQQEADRLTGVFERYLGHPAAGETPSVTVTPEGTGYRTRFDLKRMARPLESFGFGIDPATQSVLLVPNDDGTWHVASDAMPPLVMHVKDETVAIKTSTSTYEGTYDPKLGMFLDQTTTQDGATLDQDAPALTQHRRSGHTVLTQKALPVGGERADLDAHYGLSDVTAQMTMRSPPAKDAPADTPAAPGVDMSYTLATSIIDVHVGRIRPWSLLDIWAFFVAHPDHDAIVAAQEELRGLLKGALPLLGDLKEAASAEGVVALTQVGEFRAKKISGSLDLADLSGTGRIGSVLSVDGLSLPSQSLPAWSAGLLPTSLDLRPTVTGFHMDEAAREAVENFDLKHDAFTDEQSRKIGHLFWPGDGKVVLAPSHITSALLDLKLDGEATLGAVPAGHLTVTGTGLDKAIASLQAVVDSDETAAQVLTQVMAVKNLAKSNPDGSYLWVIDATASGALSVNGIPLK